MLLGTGKVVIGVSGYGFLFSVKRTDVSEITTEWVDEPNKAKVFRWNVDASRLNRALVNLREAGYENTLICELQ